MLVRAACLLLLLLVCGRSSAAPVHVADGRLTADLRDADLVDVLRDVARQGRLEVRGMPAGAPPLNLHLEAVPLEEALPRLLAGQSFVLTYGPSGLRGVKLLNGSDLTPWAMPPIPPGEPGWTPPTPEPETGALAASHRPVPIGGRLARALGAEETNFSEIVGVAMQGPDARTRADALRIALRVLDAEPELEGALLQTLDGFDDATVAAWLANAAGEHATEVARRAARAAGSDALRRRAASVERLLETRAASAQPR